MCVCLCVEVSTFVLKKQLVILYACANVVGMSEDIV